MADTTATLKAYIEDLLEDWDPTLDLSSGSPVQEQVITPLLSRLGTDPIDTDIATFILTRLEQDHPDIDIRGAGSTAGAVLADVPGLLLLALKREIQHIKVAQSIENIDQMADEEVDALLGNYFEERATGRRAEVVVRAYFAYPVSVTFDFTNLAGTGAGLKFLPKQITRVDALQMQGQMEDDLYYADVTYIAEAPGAAYNVASGDIGYIDALPNLIRVTNKAAAIVLGVDRETSVVFRDRVEGLLSERSVVGERAIKRTLLNAFGNDFKDIQVVGYGDVEMDRDILRAEIQLAQNQVLLGAVKGAGYATIMEEGLIPEALVWRPSRKVTLLDPPANVAVGDILVMGRPGVIGNVRPRLILSYDPNTHVAVLADFAIPAAGVKGETDPYYPVVGGVLLDATTAAPLLVTPIFQCAEYTTGTFANALPGDVLVRPGYVPPNVNTVTKGNATSIQIADPYTVTVYGADASTGAEVGPDLVTTHVFSAGEAVPATHAVAVAVEVGVSVTHTLLIPPYTGMILHLSPNLPANTENVKYTVYVVPGALSFLPHNLENISFFLLRLASGGIYAGLDYAGLLLSDPEDLEEEIPYTIHQALTAADINAVLAVDSMPGGILNPDTPEGTLEVASDGVHIGGCFDAYVQPKRGAVVEDTVDLLLTDDAALFRGADAILLGTEEVPSNKIEAASLSGAAVVAGMVIVLYGPDFPSPEAYVIIYVDGAGTVTIDTALTKSANNVPYYITRDVHVSLHAPKRVKLSGESLKTNMDSSVVQVEEDLAAADVVAGDTLEIQGIGQNAGLYTVTAVGVTTLTVTPQPPMAQTGLTYEIYTAYPAIARPLVRATHWEAIDEEEQPLGIVIPPRDPVDIRVLTFENEGFDVKIPNASYDGRDGVIVSSPELGLFVLLDTHVRFEDLGLGPGDWVQLLDENATEEAPNNKGWFEIRTLGPLFGLYLYSAGVDIVNQQGNVKYRAGSRSVGRARMYFLEPTYLDLGPDAVFVDSDSRAFLPSPVAQSVVVEQTTETADLAIAQDEENRWYAISATEDFRKDFITVGDMLALTTIPLLGQVLAEDAVPVSGLVVSFDFRDYPTIPILRAGTDPIPLTAGGSPGGVVEQLNRYSKGLYKVSLVDVEGDKRLRVDSPHVMRVGACTAFSTLFTNGQPGPSQWNEHATNHGTFRIGEIAGTDLGETHLYLQKYATDLDVWIDATLAVGADHKFKIVRTGHQITGPATMEGQREDGLYYADVELVSRYLGDQYNLARNTRLTVTGHVSLGYRLTTEKSELTFSAYEEVAAEISPLILNPVDGDRIAAAKNVVELSARLTYERCPSVGQAQVLLQADDVRTVCGNPLVRVMRPGYVYLTVSYGGGSSLAVIQKDLFDWLSGMGLQVQVYDVVHRISRRGAKSVAGPVTITVLVHEVDRSIRCYRTTTREYLPRTVRTIADLSGVNVSKVA